MYVLDVLPQVSCGGKLTVNITINDKKFTKIKMCIE